ncbi:MAG: bifunctional DNA-formamidopyrimidine glycosylase/DNA-(apurinic or apyrimidinic site) lyase [Acidiferrobacterales bacterium]
MPELPEIETTRRGIAPHVIGQPVDAVVVRQRQLRWPVPKALMRELPGQTIESVDRRGKYLLLNTAIGSVILHLGMSGSLRIVPQAKTPEKYDHVDLVFANGDCLRLRDPRRFGAVLWTKGDVTRHRLLANIGPDPLAHSFGGDYLYRKSRGRTRAIRDLLIDSRIVAGVGNIYANEALYGAGIHPRRAAGRISRRRYQRLTQAIRTTLKRAIAAGGTTLRDFRGASGNPGYFQLTMQVYGREGEPCRRCRRPIRAAPLGGRRVFYCSRCQL